MRRLATLLAAALLIVSCGRAAPAGQPSPTPAAATVAPAGPATPGQPPLADPGPPAALPPEAGGAAITPVPPAAFDRLRYLLPTDLAGYTIPTPDATWAGPTGFGIGLIAPGQEPSPRVTIVLAGGEAAFPEWHLHQNPDGGATRVAVRGVTGSVHDDGVAFRLLWEESGNVYTVLWPTGTLDELIAFADGLVAYDAATWLALAGLAAPTPDSPRPARTP